MRDWLVSLVDPTALDDDDQAQIDQAIARLSGSGEAAALAAMEIVKIIGETRDPDALIRSLDVPFGFTADEESAAEVITLALHAFAAVRVDYGDQPSAALAREALSAGAERVYAIVDETYGADVLAWLVQLTGEAVLIISALAANLVPMVRIETAIPLPSSLLAYDLYGDAERGGNLVRRNAAATALAMPKILEAPAA